MSDRADRPLAVVTGAGGGIGAAIARLADQRGYAVAVLDVDGDRAGEVAAELDGGRHFAVDVVDEGAVEAVLDELPTAPSLVVSNAGIVRFGPLLDLDLAAWRAVVDVNLTGTFVVCRAAARRMVAAGSGGAIVAITSMNGVVPGPNSGAYTATKAGASLLVGQMAIEWGGHGIRVNAVAPGLIDGGMSGPIYADPVFREARESRVPAGRLGTEEDIARAVLFLAGDDAAYITGQTLLVDGGVTHNMISQLPRPPAVERPDAEARVRALIVSGGLAHDFAVTSARLAAALGGVGITATIDEDPEAAFASLPRDDVELLVVNALRWRMEGVERYAALREEWGLSLSPAARDGVEAHVAAGRPLLAMHSASICFDDWPRWGELVGGAWDWDRSSHPPLDGEVDVTVARDRHPIVAGLDDFAIVDEVYGFLDRQPDVIGLLHSPHGGTDHPLLWARTLPDGARVVYDALGHDGRSYDHPTHQQLLRRIGAWLQGRDDADVAATT